MLWPQWRGKGTAPSVSISGCTQLSRPLAAIRHGSLSLAESSQMVPVRSTWFCMESDIRSRG